MPLGRKSINSPAFDTNRRLRLASGKAPLSITTIECWCVTSYDDAGERSLLGEQNALFEFEGAERKGGTNGTNG